MQTDQNRLILGRCVNDDGQMLLPAIFGAKGNHRGVFCIFKRHTGLTDFAEARGRCIFVAVNAFRLQNE